MKPNLLFVLITIFALAFAGANEKFTLVEFQVNHDEISQLQNLGLAIDCCHNEVQGKKHTFRVPVNSKEMESLNKLRMSYKVVVDDMEKFYAKRNAVAVSQAAIEASKTLATDMKLGTMGGFLKLNEMLTSIDTLHKKHGSKNLITKRVSIGKTARGQDIWMIKISDNADVDERNEPGVLYTSLHHAREPAGMMTTVYFMHHLIENYDKSERVRNIVNKSQIYFIPMVNPDSYLSNQKNNPNGGGMIRKNANGVDLNRNYGPHEYWNYPNGGSSTSPWSQTYRGKAPFSEPETKAVRDFVTGKNIHVTLNYHTYSNLLIYPLGIRDQLAHPMFKTMAREMTKINKYRIGTAQGLLYAVRGCSDDWFWKEIPGKKRAIFAMTPEVGSRSDGFWPRSTRIFPLAEENLEANLLLAEYAIKMAK